MKKSTIYLTLFFLLIFTTNASAINEELIFQLNHKPTQQDYNDLASQGCTVTYEPRHLNLLIATCAEQQNIMSAVQQANSPYQIWENEMFTPALNDGAQIIEAIQAWNSSYDGSGIKIGIMDTGINTSHPALTGQFDAEIDFYDGGTAEDLCNHGTPVAGILASLNETYRGIAHGARFYNLKVAQFVSGQCGASSSDIIEAIDYSVENNLEIVSMSLGASVSDCDLSITALYVNETIAQDGINLVIIAGNSGPSNNSIWSPGCAQNAITVGSVDKDKTLSSFSSRGPVNDYNKPDILAPGRNIISTGRDGTFLSGFTGTSFAAPFVTGVVALMLQANTGLNWTQVKEVLANSSTDLGYAENEQGAGLANASKAVEIALTINTTQPTIYNQTIATLTKTGSADPLNISNTTIIQYQVNLSIQNGTAYNATIEEKYPDNATFVSATPNPNNGNNLWNVGNLTAGQTFQINITLNLSEELTNGTVLTNKVNTTYFNETGQEETKETSKNTTIIKNQPIIFEDYSGLLIFSQNTNTPTYKDIYENSTFGEDNIFGSIGTPIWIKSKAAPNKNETSIVIQNVSNAIHFYIHTPQTNMTAPVLLTSDAGGAQRRFDMDYDKNGNSIIVFATGNSTPSYKVWDGTDFILSGVLPQDSCTSNTAWIQVAASTTENSTIAMYADTSGRYCAQVWNGSQWGQNRHFDTDTGITTEKFSIEFEGTSGNALAVFESPTPGVISYCEWTGNWCVSNSDLSDRGSQNDWIRLSSEPTSNRILLGTYQSGNGDVDTIEWNGSKFGTWKSVDTSVETGGDRIFDISYAGNTGKAIMVFTDNNKKVPSFSTCDNSSSCFSGIWNSNSLTTSSENNCGENSDLDFVTLTAKPNSSEILLTALSQANHHKCAQFYDGTNWQTWFSSLGSSSANLAAEDISAVFDAD